MTDLPVPSIIARPRRLRNPTELDRLVKCDFCEESCWQTAGEPMPLPKGVTAMCVRCALIRTKSPRVYMRGLTK